MKFVYADSMDFIDPDYDFESDRTTPGRAVQRDDEYPHEFLGKAPYDGILVSRGIVGDLIFKGKYTDPQWMRFRREGARKFLRYEEKDYPGSLLFGDCGAFQYRNLPEPPYRAADTVDFYGDGGFTHGCSVDHLIFDFDEEPARRSHDIPEDTRKRYEITLQLAKEFKAASKALGKSFTPMGVVQGWSAKSMADAAVDLVKMGYQYIAVGGLVPLREVQIQRALTAIREAIPSKIQLHLLGFGKIDNILDYEKFGVASFDTTSPLLRAFKDARKNYFWKNGGPDLEYFTAVRVPQAISNKKLKQRAREGRLNQEMMIVLERASLEGLRAYSKKKMSLEDTLDAVIAYWDALNWTTSDGAKPRESSSTQRREYGRVLSARPWDLCDCKVCKESGIEAIIFRSSNRNKRRGIHNLHIFYQHLHHVRTAAR